MWRAPKKRRSMGDPPPPTSTRKRKAEEVTLDDSAASDSDSDLSLCDILQQRLLQSRLRPVTSLMSHQTQSVEHFVKYLPVWKGGILADEMGLGKTLQALTIAWRLSPTTPVLVVSSPAVLLEWLAQLKRHAPHAKAFQCTGPTMGSLGGEAADVLLCSYTLARMYYRNLRKVHIKVMIVDECHMIRNPRSLTAKALRKISPHAMKLGLSGTPGPNRPFHDLAGVFTTLLPQSHKLHRARFFEKACTGHHRKYSTLQQVLVRRTKAEVLEGAALKECRSRVHCHPMYVSEEDAYEQQLKATGSVYSRYCAVGNPLQKAMLLRQYHKCIRRLGSLALHPQLREIRKKEVDPRDAADSMKLLKVVQLVQATAPQRIVVTSTSTAFLDVVAARLHALHIAHVFFTGRTSHAQRQLTLREWKGKGGAQVLLLSACSGGQGLTLTEGAVIVLTDTSAHPNPCVEDQVVARLHRIGQRKRVRVHHLRTRHTIDEAMVAVHQRKRELAHTILTYSQAEQEDIPSQYPSIRQLWDQRNNPTGAGFSAGQ